MNRLAVYSYLTRCDIVIYRHMYSAKKRKLTLKKMFNWTSRFSALVRTNPATYLPTYLPMTGLTGSDVGSERAESDNY